jgi:AcrR family transcriptional regulator
MSDAMPHDPDQAAEARPDGRTERAQRQREERRAAILDAALNVFADKGYHNASITDLVQAAGVARGTFYLYFESKSEVFTALIDELFTRFRSTIVGVDTKPGAPSLTEQLTDRVLAILTAVQGSRAVARVLFREANVLEPEVHVRARGMEDALLGYLQYSLDNGVRLGLLRVHDTTLAATVMYGSLRQVIDRYLLSTADEPDLHHLAHEVVAVAMRGLHAPTEPAP